MTDEGLVKKLRMLSPLLRADRVLQELEKGNDVPSKYVFDAAQTYENCGNYRNAAWIANMTGNNGMAHSLYKKAEDRRSNSGFNTGLFLGLGLGAVFVGSISALLYLNGPGARSYSESEPAPVEAKPEPSDMSGPDCFQKKIDANHEYSEQVRLGFDLIKCGNREEGLKLMDEATAQHDAALEECVKGEQ